MITLLLWIFPQLVAGISPWDGCFDKIPHRTLIGSSIVIKEDISLSRCQTACLELAGDRCRSISYTEINGRCELNKGDHETTPKSLMLTVGWVDYYFRTCYDKPSVAVLRDDSQFDDNCFETIPEKILIGVVDELIQDTESIEDCRKACQKRQGSGVICKSAAYSEKEKECIIASQSRKDIPDLFVDDDKFVYIENTCLDGSHAKDSSVKKIVPNKNKPNKSSENLIGSGNGMDTMGVLPKENPSKASVKDYLFGGKKPLEARKSPQPYETYDLGIGIDSGGTENLLTTPPAPAIHKVKIPLLQKPIQVEQSGYDSNSEGIIGAGATDVFTTTTTQRPIQTAAPKVVDSYGVEVTPKSTGYGRRLRDAGLKTCFQEVRPMYAMIESRVSRAYSLEQCTDICRLCLSCLRGKKCRSVAYDRSRDLCALSLTPLVDGGDNDSGIVFHNRLESTECNRFPFRSRSRQ